MKAFLFIIIIFFTLTNCKNRKPTEDEYIKRGNEKIETESSNQGGYVSLDVYKEAIADYNRAIEINDTNIVAFLNRGYAKALLGVKYPDTNEARNNYLIDAIADLNYAIKIDSKYVHSYYFRGNTKFDLKDYRGSISDYDKVLKMDSNYIRAYINRSLAKYYLKDYIGAIYDCTKALEIKNYIYYHVFENLFPLTVKYGPIRVYTTQGKEFNYKGDIYERRSLVKIEIRDYNGAINDYTQAIETKDGYERNYYMARGLAKIILNQKDSGCLDLSKAGELGARGAYDSIKKYCQ